MADRLAALDGTLEVRSVPGGGTTVAGRIPVTPSVVTEAEATDRATVVV
jgi:chemotaxis protein histidine kinase CheA